MHPRPTEEEISLLYNEYLPASPEDIYGWQRMMKPVINAAIKLISRFTHPPGNLLDFGCGYGFFLEEAVKKGWNGYGIEISPVARKRILSIDNCKLIEIEELNSLPRGFFKLITLFYVIEHLPDPIALLKTLRPYLAHDGILFLRYPYTAPIIDLLGLRLSERLSLMQAPAHLYDYSSAALRYMLRSAGFREVLTTISGNTAPNSIFFRMVSRGIGGIASILALCSKNKLLVPGFSRVTIAAIEPDLIV